MLQQSQGLLIAAESKLAELRKQYDVMPESKQIELSRHLKELSHRNDWVVAWPFSNYQPIYSWGVVVKLKIVLLGNQSGENMKWRRRRLSIRKKRRSVTFSSIPIIFIIYVLKEKRKENHIIVPQQWRFLSSSSGQNSCRNGKKVPKTTGRMQRRIKTEIDAHAGGTRCSGIHQKLMLKFVLQHFRSVSAHTIAS